MLRKINQIQKHILYLATYKLTQRIQLSL